MPAPVGGQRVNAVREWEGTGKDGSKRARHVTCASAAAGLIAGCVLWNTPSSSRRVELGQAEAAAQASISTDHSFHQPAVRAETTISSSSLSSRESMHWHNSSWHVRNWLFQDRKKQVGEQASASHIGFSNNVKSWPSQSVVHKKDNLDSGWGQLLVSAGDSRHQLKHRFGLFGPSIVMELRSEMLSLDPRIDAYDSSRQVFDQIGLFVMIVATVVGVLIIWDTWGLGACVGDAFRRRAQEQKALKQNAQGDNIASGEEASGSLLSSFRGVGGSTTARGSDHQDVKYTSLSAPGTFSSIFGERDTKYPHSSSISPTEHDQNSPQGDVHVHSATAPSAPTIAQRMGLAAMPARFQDNLQPRDSPKEPRMTSNVLPGLGMEIAWEPTPFLFFVLGLFCQLPLMTALCCYSFFAQTFAGAGADGLSYFPVVVSVAQLITSASVSTVLREFNWMVKAVFGLLIAVPAILLIPIYSYPNGGILSLFAVSLAIGLSSGLTTVLLAMALSCEPKTDTRMNELTNDYRGSSRDWAGLSDRMARISERGTQYNTGMDASLVTALWSGQSAGAVLVVGLWMAVKASGQGTTHYVEHHAAVLNGGRIELMMAAFGCIFGAYVCTRVCAGRFDTTSLTESDPVAEAELVQTVRPFALALMLNSMCSTLLFPRLLDSAPSKYGTRPDWLASDLTLLYCVADLAGRVFSHDVFKFCEGKQVIREWQRAHGPRAMIWVATARGAALSLFILAAITCGWQDDSLLILYVCFTGLSHGLLSVGIIQAGARDAESLGWRGQGTSTGLHLVSASAFGVGEAMGCLIGFALSSGIWV